MFTKIKKYLHPYNLRHLNDMRMLGLLAFGVIVLLVTWSGIKAIQTNYELQKQIAELEQKNEVSLLENQNQKLKNQYLETDQFLELAARRQFGLAAPGEKVIIIPKAVALAHTADLPPTTTPSDQKTSSNKPAYQRNFQAWIDFFLHRTDQDV